MPAEQAARHQPRGVDDARQAAARAAAPRRSRSTRRRARACCPGTYTVRLTKGAESSRPRSTVGLDRRAPYTAADRKAQFDAAMRVARAVRRHERARRSASTPYARRRDATRREPPGGRSAAQAALRELSGKADDAAQEDRRDQGGRRDHRRGAHPRAHRHAVRRDPVVGGQAGATIRSRGSRRSVASSPTSSRSLSRCATAISPGPTRACTRRIFRKSRCPMRPRRTPWASRRIRRTRTRRTRPGIATESAGCRMAMPRGSLRGFRSADAGLARTGSSTLRFALFAATMRALVTRVSHAGPDSVIAVGGVRSQCRAHALHRHAARSCRIAGRLAAHRLDVHSDRQPNDS